MKISAYRGDEETWRIERLEEVAKRCPSNVLALHDRKGNLSVNWATMPTIEDLTAVVQAWCDQNEYSIDHYLNNDEVLAADLDWCSSFEEATA